MSPSLPVLILSLVAVSPMQTASASPTSTHEEAVRRVKRGLLPRRSGPSKVVDLQGAAGRRLEAQDFARPRKSVPADAALPMEAPPAATASQDSRAEAAPAVTSSRASRAEVPPAATASRVSEAEDAPEATASQESEPARVEMAREVQPETEEAEANAKAEERAPDEVRDEAVSVSVLTETIIDARGRIIERRMRRDRQLLSVRVVARIDELPVLSSERLDDGRIRERVEFAGASLEVLRDPVGRFLSVRTPPDDEDDQGESDESDED